MHWWLRILLAVLAGFVVWIVVATAGNVVLRLLLPGYAAVEEAMDFSLGMLFARLGLGAVSSVAAGWGCAAIARSARVAVYGFAFLLFGLFLAEHVGLWDRFPIWYHLFFLGTLVPLIALGARLAGSHAGRSATPALELQ